MHSQDFYNYLEMFGMENVACRYLFLPLVYLYGWHVCRMCSLPWGHAGSLHLPAPASPRPGTASDSWGHLGGRGGGTGLKDQARGCNDLAGHWYWKCHLA